MSPSQMILGRRLKTDLPMTSPLLESANQKSENRSRMQFRKDKYKIYYDKHAGNQLKPLSEGENVIMQKGKEWLPATVSEKHYYTRSYIVKTDNGKRYRRNRKHLRPTKSYWPVPDNEEPS